MVCVCAFVTYNKDYLLTYLLTVTNRYRNTQPAIVSLRDDGVELGLAPELHTCVEYETSLLSNICSV